MMRTPRKREIKACTACAKLKVKCEWGQRSEKCKRCQRLRKECENQMPGAHCHKRLLDGQSSRADLLRLESKVDSVSRLLSTSSSHSPHVLLPPSPNPSPMPVPAPDTTIPTDHEAIYLLNLYRAEMAPLFPFVVISRRVTPEQLRLEKPVLYMAIMMVACQSDVHRQLSIARIVRQEISQAVLIRSERSLALLEGLLLYIAWNHVHLQLGHQLLLLQHMAIAMLTDLGLNKEPHFRPKTAAGAFREAGPQVAMEPARTLEERRVFLGVFWVTSLTKTCFKEMQALRFTNYAESCCRILENATNHPNDTYLVHVVRLQQRVERVGDILYSEDLDTVSGMNPPLAMIISSLEKEVSDATTGLPSNIRQTPLLQMSYRMLQLYLYKIALDDRLFPPQSPYATLRTNLLFSCLAAIESLVSLFFELPAQTILSLPYPNWGQVGHAMLILSRLAEVKHGTWDTGVVSSVLDHRETFRRLARRLEEVMAVGAKETPPRSFPEVFALMIDKLRDLGSSEGRREDEALMDGEDLNHMLCEDEMMGGILFDFFDLGQGV